MAMLVLGRVYTLCFLNSEPQRSKAKNTKVFHRGLWNVGRIILCISPIIALRASWKQRGMVEFHNFIVMSHDASHSVK